MHFRLLGIAGAGLMLALSPAASAADLATLGCVTEQLSPQTREAFVVSARTLGSGAVEPVSAEIRSALDAAIDICSKRFNWSVDAADAAQYVVMSELGLPELRKSATAVGVDPDAVAAAVADLSPALIAGLATGDETSVAALLDAFEKHKVSLGSEAQQRAIFTLAVITSRHLAERARFAAH